MSSTTATGSTAFTQDTVAMINRAYAKACSVIVREGGSDELRPKVGEHMLDLARSGERDEARLCCLSILAVLGRKAAGLCNAR